MHKYFGTSADWGWVWPEDAVAAANGTHRPPPPPMAPMDHGIAASYAPWLVLAALVASVVVQGSIGRTIGDVACGWRLSYSPASPAFAIWGLIYAGNAVAIVVQIVDSVKGIDTYAAAPWVNYLFAWAWLQTGVWVCFFGGTAGGARKVGITVAAFIIVSAAMTATGAVCIEGFWRRRDAWAIAAVGVWYSLFAGWLCVASALGIGVAWAANTRPFDAQCTRQSREERRRTYNTFVRAGVDERSCVPLLVAILISIPTFLVPDPALAVPAIVGIYFVKGHFKNWLALELLTVTTVAALVSVVTGVWYDLN